MKKSQFTRRDFLRIAAAGAGGAVLAACAPAAVPQAPAAEQPGEGAAPAAVPEGPLSLVYWADTNDFFKQVLDQWNEETGIEVEYEVAPAGYLEWQQYMTTRLAGGETIPDTFHGDDFQSAIYGAAGWLTPLDDLVDQYDIDLSDWPQTLVTDVSAWDGKLYRLPWGSDTEIFFYRTDYFEQAGVEPPKDWNELVEVAEILTDVENDRWGIALSGQKNGVLGNDIQHWTNQAGGAINRLDHPGSREALVFYKDLFTTHQVAPPSTPQEDYTTINQGFLDGKYAMWWCWDGFLGGFRTDEEFWQGQVSAFLPPMGPENAQTTTGTWGWSINAFSEKQDLAGRWLEFTARPEIMKLQIIRGRVPARTSLWSDVEVQDMAPSAVYLAELAAAGDLVKARPVTPSIQEIYDAAEESVHAYLTDQVGVDEAIDNAMSKIGPILDRDLGNS